MLSSFGNDDKAKRGCTVIDRVGCLQRETSEGPTFHILGILAVMCHALPALKNVWLKFSFGN